MARILAGAGIPPVEEYGHEFRAHSRVDVEPPFPRSPGKPNTDCPHSTEQDTLKQIKSILFFCHHHHQGLDLL